MIPGCKEETSNHARGANATVNYKEKGNTEVEMKPTGRTQKLTG